MEWRVREPKGPNAHQWTQPRLDQLKAIQKYMTTGKNSINIIPHISGIGHFNVTFGDIITSYKGEIITSYTKEDGVKVEVMFGNENDFVYSNRMMNGFFRAKKSKKKSKKRSNRLRV